MNELFTPSNDDNDIVNDNNGKMSIRKTSFSKKISRHKRNNSFDEILDENGGLPKPNECLLIKSNGVSDTGSLFHYMTNEYKCDELILATWIISRDSIDYICELIDNGKLERLIFIISVRQKQLKKADYAYMIEQFQERDRIRFRVCNSHAKTFSAKIGDNYYTVIGSGNWTRNPRIENYIIHNDKDIYQFNKDWMGDLL